MVVHQERQANVFEYAGNGCELAPVGSRALAEFLDVDESGAVYGYPLDAEWAGSVVKKVDRLGVATEVVSAGRGIWGFGVSPSGRTMWMSACGPTGILSTADWRTEVMPAPATLWEQSGAVLTGDDVFWSIDVRTCAWDAPLGPDCGFGLVRTTPAGNERVGDTVLDFGHGFEPGALARCGDGVCVFTPHGLVAHDAAGLVRARLSTGELGVVSDGASITSVSANELGLYVGLSTSEFVFMPWSEAARFGT